MTRYFIDLENVASQGLEGLDEIGNDVEINIFWTDKSCKMPMSDVARMMKMTDKINLIHAECGESNALDLQLVTHIMCTYRPDVDHVIVSKDCGYKYVVKTAREFEHKNIRIIHQLKDDLSVPTKKSAVKQTPTKTSATTNVNKEAKATSGKKHKKETKTDKLAKQITNEQKDELIQYIYERKNFRLTREQAAYIFVFAKSAENINSYKSKVIGHFGKSAGQSIYSKTESEFGWMSRISKV